jgi:diadenylate cyclase
MNYISAIAQIAILYFVIYAILRGAKGSRFGQALTGVGIIGGLLFVFSYLFNFDVLTRIVQFLLLYLAVSTVVIFQPEIRRILMTIGAFGYFEKPKYVAGDVPTVQFVAEVLSALSKSRTGVLIAFERGISLRSYEATGVKVDAVFSNELLRSIFMPPNPLHDGGVIMRAGRISSAHCVFPVSNNSDLMEHGMRHRAAVGLSEETDALVFVVSEETGAVSVAHNGRLVRYSADFEEPLVRWLSRAMPAHHETKGFFGVILKIYDKIQNIKKKRSQKKVKALEVP